MRVLRSLYLGVLPLLASCVPVGEMGPFLPSMNINMNVLGVTDVQSGDLAVGPLPKFDDVTADSAQCRSCGLPYRLGETAPCFAALQVPASRLRPPENVPGHWQQNRYARDAHLVRTSTQGVLQAVDEEIPKGTANP